MYDVHRLRLLRELHMRGTLAAVAHALGYSPSAVSHQLATLEREAGVALLEPAGRRVRLTPAAEALVGHTEIILRELERAEAAVAAVRDTVAGAVRLATFQTAAHTIVPDALSRLRAEHPQLRVTIAHVDAAAAIPALRAREFDVVLSERYPGESPQRVAGVETVVLVDDPVVIAVAERHPARTLADLRDDAWVMEPPGTHARPWATMLCRAAGFEPRVDVQSSDVLLHLRLVAEGMCVALVPSLAGGRDGVRMLPTGASRTIELSTRTGAETSPAIGAVTAALRSAAVPRA